MQEEETTNPSRTKEPSCASHKHQISLAILQRVEEGVPSLSKHLVLRQRPCKMRRRHFDGRDGRGSDERARVDGARECVKRVQKCVGEMAEQQERDEKCEEGKRGRAGRLEMSEVERVAGTVSFRAGRKRAYEMDWRARFGQGANSLSFFSS
jgi:hypothetical protein